DLRRKRHRVARIAAERYRQSGGYAAVRNGFFLAPEKRVSDPVRWPGEHSAGLPAELLVGPTLLSAFPRNHLTPRNLRFPWEVACAFRITPPTSCGCSSIGSNNAPPPRPFGPPPSASTPIAVAAPTAAATAAAPSTSANTAPSRRPAGPAPSTSPRNCPPTSAPP